MDIHMFFALIVYNHIYKPTTIIERKSSVSLEKHLEVRKVLFISKPSIFIIRLKNTALPLLILWSLLTF
jgi:hypothetical protein